MIDKDTRTGPIRKYVMWSLYPVLCTLSSVLCHLYSVICTLSSVLCTLSSVICLCTLFLPSRGQGRDNSICSANEYRGQGRDNTEDKIAPIAKAKTHATKGWRSKIPTAQLYSLAIQSPDMHFPSLPCKDKHRIP